MRRARQVGLAFLTVLVFTAAGCAGTEGERSTQGAAPPPAPSSAVVGEGTFCIQGVVLGEDRLPIPRVQVDLIQTLSRVETGPDGAFEFCGLESGSYRINFQALGYESALRSVDVPMQAEQLQVILKPIPIAEPRDLTIQKVIHYTFGLSTLDTATSRYGVNLTTCGPCTFSWEAPGVPAFLVWEANWQRNPPPPSGIQDMMYHILRGGAPFSSGTDAGTGTFGKPWRAEYSEETLLKNALIKGAANKGAVPMSGSMFCWGSQAWPCIDQRINVWLTMFYDVAEVPAEFTALPPG